MAEKPTPLLFRIPGPVAAVRIPLLTVLFFLFLPLPRIIAYLNPAGSTILGRYTLRYFALMSGYLAICAVWAALTAYAIWWLDDSTLRKVRGYMRQHLWQTAGGVLLLLGGLTASRLILLLDLIGTPYSFKGLVELLPTIVSVALVALLVVLVDDNVAQAVARTGQGVAQRLPPALHRIRRIVSRHAVLLTLGPVLGLFLGSLFVGNLWDYPLDLDPSVHIYLGQELLRGGIPYQSVIYFHPPLRFAISVLWAVTARAVHQPIPLTVHVIDMLVTTALIVLVYLVGREAANSRAGGVLAVVLLFATEHLNELIIGGPTFRLTTGLLMLLGLWAGQRGRWFWAGLAGTLAALTYLPAGAVLPALATAALVQEADSSVRWRSLTRAVAGAAVVLGLTLLVLAGFGAVADAYRESTRSVFLMLGNGGTGAAASSSIAERLERVRVLLGWLFRGDTEFALILMVGPLLLLVRKGLGVVGRSPRLHILFVATGWLLLPLVKTFDASVRDSFLILLPLAPLGAAALTSLFGVPPDRRWLQRLLVSGVIVWGLIIGMADLVDHNRYLYQRITMTYAEQRSVAASLKQALLPGEQVQSVGNLWYQTATDSPNALPIIQIGARGRWANTAAGWTDADILAALQQEPPVVIFLVGGEDVGRPLADWLADAYVNLGRIDPAGDLFWQSVYVRADRLELREILDQLPLESDAGGR